MFRHSRYITERLL